MSTQDNGAANTAVTTDAQQGQQQTQQPQQVQHQQQGSPQQWADNMLAAMNALPERIVKSLQEAAPKQPASQQNQQNQQGQQQQNQQQQPAQQQKRAEPGAAPQGMTALAKWWYGL